MNPAFANFVGSGLFDNPLANRRLAESNPARAKVGNFATPDQIALATAPQFQRVIPNVLERAVLDQNLARTLRPKCARDANGSLRKTANLRLWRRRNNWLVFSRVESIWKIPLGVRKS